MRATESARSENARNLSRFFNESGYIKNIFQILIRDGQDFPAELPALVESNVRPIRSAHPDAVHQLLSGNEARSFIAAHFDSDVVAAYDLLKPYSYKADLARY